MQNTSPWGDPVNSPGEGPGAEEYVPKTDLSSTSSLFLGGCSEMTTLAVYLPWLAHRSRTYLRGMRRRNLRIQAIQEDQPPMDGLQNPSESRLIGAAHGERLLSPLQFS